MNRDIERLMKGLGRDVSLTESERLRMRELLSEYAAMRPVRPAPLGARGRARRSAFSYVMRPAFSFAAIVLMVAVGGSGVAYAAEESLPGDLLYPVKVDVIEKTFTAFTPRGPLGARWQMRLAERRLAEAAALAKEGRLDASVEAALAERFAQAADEAASMVGETSPTEATIASASFSTRLASYDTVLGRIAERRLAGEGPLRSAIRAKVDAWRAERAAVALSAENDSGLDADPAALEVEADRSWKRVAGAAEGRAVVLNATGTEQVARSLEEASRLIEEGREHLKNREVAEARKAFRQAIRTTARLDVLVHASADLKVDDLIDAEAVLPGAEEGNEESDEEGSGGSDATSTPSATDGSASSGVLGTSTDETAEEGRASTTTGGQPFPTPTLDISL